MAELLLTMSGLTVGYGSKEVLHGIDLELSEGEAVALLGPNGCGKTTLLRAVCGSLKLWGGTVAVSGSDIVTLDYRARAKKMAYVPQSEVHTFEFTVRELALMGRLPHSDGLFESPEDHEAVGRAMADADCTDFADRMISSLSGGEAQRALIARALAQEAPLLLCDEPTTHLDPKHQVEIAELLGKLKSQGRGILVSSHDLNWAMRCCDRCALIRDGRIVYDGPFEAAIAGGWHEAVYDMRFETMAVDGRTYVLPKQD